MKTPLFTFLLAITLPLLAAQPPSPTDADSFPALYRDWTALEKQLDSFRDRFGNATAETREEIRKQYEQSVADSAALLPKLGIAAEAAYRAAPNKDPDVLRTVLGIMAYHYRRDDYDSALKLAALLEENKCPEALFHSIAGFAAYGAGDFAAAEKSLLAAEKAGKLDPRGKDLLAELPARQQDMAAEQKIRENEAAADDLPRVKIETNKGTIVVELYENEAPQAVANFISLVEQKFYDGLTFHRVLAGFMAQGGDPTGRGSGGPGYRIYCECDKPEARKHFRGTLSMAHAGKNTGGSQFFLTFRPTTHLDGRHTAFGRVIEGVNVLPELQRRDPQSPNPPEPDKIIKAEVLRKRPHAYEPTKVQ